VRVGWVASHTLSDPRGRHFWTLRPPVSMRIANTARWISANHPDVRNEMYRRGRDYDVVVFFKTMDGEAQAEARAVQAGGGRVVFDANVNYYEVWGEYDIPATRPTEEQQRDAAAMTALADHVVADSTYLLGVVRQYNDSATAIPDNVDLRRFRGTRDHAGRALRLVWSGVAKKASPLSMLAEPLAGLDEVELVLVSDEEPAVLAELRQVLPVRFVRFSERRYARTLLECDVIVSPKRLTNAYELGHTEYKITLGMAVGLPAVATPQQSYVEAIEHAGGGVLADDAAAWRDAFVRLRDPAVRADLGARAQATVRERYATPVVAQAYADLLRSLA
jgi:glycosyltransferase involved in cell wall biosynthesis